MKTRTSTFLIVMAVIGSTVLVTGRVVSDGKPDGMAEMWAQWMALAAPGEEHRHLLRATGTWKQRNTHWMHPGAEPMTSESVAVMRPVLGGRFMLEEVQGTHEIGGQVIAFEGIGLFGFDNYKQKHTFVWLDNMGTLMMTAEGEADPTGQIITYYSEMPNPMDGAVMELKSVSRTVNDDEHVFEMYQRQPDGTWFRNFEVVATRQ